MMTAVTMTTMTTTTNLERRGGSLYGALLVAVAHNLVACDGCSTPAGAGDLARIVDAARPAADSSSASNCEPATIPPQVPPGWEEFADWSCKCRFYVPKTTLPAPIVWEPCGGSVPATVSCRSMKVDWTTTDPVPLGVTPKGWVDSQGRVFLRFTRLDRYSTTPSAQYVVAEADGPAHSGILSTAGASKPGCVIADFSDMRENHVAWFVTGDDARGDWSTSRVEGAIGGDIDELRPRILFRFEDDYGYYFSVSSRWIGVWSTNASTMNLYSWTDLLTPTKIASAPSDPEQLSPSTLHLVGADAFWQLNSLSRVGIMSWDASSGSRALIRWNGDVTRGAWDLGTDGAQMVWEYGSNRSLTALPTDPFPTRSVMVAPYTTNSTNLQPRRLRSDPSTGYQSRYSVGCGYAARTTDSADLFVVRLSDGWSWTLKAVPSLPTMSFSKALATTCTEVFVGVTLGATPQIARIRIDSLGAGVAPD